jgi:hypothetical protein
LTEENRFLGYPENIELEHYHKMFTLRRGLYVTYYKEKMFHIKLLSSYDQLRCDRKPFDSNYEDFGTDGYNIHRSDSLTNALINCIRIVKFKGHRLSLFQDHMKFGKPMKCYKIPIHQKIIYIEPSFIRKFDPRCFKFLTDPFKWIVLTILFCLHRKKIKIYKFIIFEILSYVNLL